MINGWYEETPGDKKWTCEEEAYLFKYQVTDWVVKNSVKQFYFEHARLEINVGCIIFYLSSDLLGEHPWALTVVDHLPPLLVAVLSYPLSSFFPPSP